MRFVVGIVALAGCYSPSIAPGGPCSDDGTCPTGQMCYSGRCFASPPLEDGGLEDAGDAPPDTPPDVAIDACGGNVCSGGNLVGCGSTTTCAYGCLTTGTPHCARIKPSNALSWNLVPFPGGTLTLGSGAHVFDTTAGVLTTNGSAVALPSAVATQVVGTMQVLALGDLVLQTGATLTVRGARPLAILADGNVTIASGATILLGAGCSGTTYDPTCGGPGGGHGGRNNADPAEGCGHGDNGAEDFDGLNGAEAGGGGAGYGRSGEHSVSGIPGEGARGDSCGNSSLEPLVGGSGGGAGGISPSTDERRGGRGGGGGGAIQITASGTLLVSGAIDAAGAGGENGYFDGASANNGGGGGGGSGGGILLEAGVLMVPGTITSNGGAGGGNHTTIALGHGESGRRDRSCAIGGQATASGSPGGRGDCDMQGPNGGGTNNDRGGGGAGVGRIRFNARSNMLGGATISGNQTNGGPPQLE